VPFSAYSFEKKEPPKEQTVPQKTRGGESLGGEKPTKGPKVFLLFFFLSLSSFSFLLPLLPPLASSFSFDQNPEGTGQKEKELIKLTINHTQHRMEYVNTVDEEFFNQRHIQAIIRGKNPREDFQRSSSSDLPQASSKKHFKKKKGKWFLSSFLFLFSLFLL